MVSKYLFLLFLNIAFLESSVDFGRLDKKRFAFDVFTLAHRRNHLWINAHAVVFPGWLFILKHGPNYFHYSNCKLCAYFKPLHEFIKGVSRVDDTIPWPIKLVMLEGLLLQAVEIKHVQQLYELKNICEKLLFLFLKLLKHI